MSDAPSTIPQPQLRPPRHPIESNVLWWWMLQALAIHIPVLLGVLAAVLWWPAARPWTFIALLLVACSTVVSVVVEPMIRRKVHRWEVTDQAVYSRTGWWTVEWRVAPISRIQTVDAVRGPLEQALGLSTLRVTTASSRGAIDIVGLDHEVAARVAERLAAVTERTPGDAT